MTKENRDRLLHGAKMFGIILVALLSMIVCAGVWNVRGEVFAQVCAGLLLAGNGITLWRLAKRINDEYVKNLREETKIKK